MHARASKSVCMGVLKYRSEVLNNNWIGLVNADDVVRVSII